MEVVGASTQIMESKIKSMLNPKAVLLFSGGMDSTLILHKYQNAIEHLLYVSLGTVQDGFQIVRARKLADHYKKEFNIIYMTNTCYSQEKIIKSTDAKRAIVPFRNGLFIAAATNFAAHHNLKVVLIGTHDFNNGPMPDTHENFIDRMTIATEYSDNVSVLAPLQTMSKKEIAQQMIDIQAPIEQTYSCYRGGIFHCGKCHACTERKLSLGDADPTMYK